MSGGPPSDEAGKLPEQVRGQIIADLANSIEPGLPESVPNRAAVAENAAEAALNDFIEKGAVAVGTVEESFSMLHVGPVPPVGMVRGYEELYPGAAKVMFDMAVRDQEAFIQSREKKATRDDRFRIISICLGFSALLALLGATLVAALYGHDWIAGSIIAIGAGGIIATFVGAPHLIPGRGKPEPAAPTPQNSLEQSDAGKS